MGEKNGSISCHLQEMTHSLCSPCSWTFGQSIINTSSIYLFIYFTFCDSSGIPGLLWSFRCYSTSIMTFPPNIYVSDVGNAVQYLHTETYVLSKIYWSSILEMSTSSSVWAVQWLCTRANRRTVSTFVVPCACVLHTCMVCVMATTGLPVMQPH